MGAASSGGCADLRRRWLAALAMRFAVTGNRGVRTLRPGSSALDAELLAGGAVEVDGSALHMLKRCGKRVTQSDTLFETHYTI